MTQQPSADEVAQLIVGLYDSKATPIDIHNINAALTTIQSSPFALSLAEQLCRYDNPQIRFYAALLFETYAGGAGANMDEEDKATLKGQYLDLLAYAVNEKWEALEYGKACNAVSSLFVSLKGWQECYRDFAKRVFLRSCSSPMPSCGVDMTELYMKMANEPDLTYILSFLDALVARVQWLDDRTLEQHTVHEALLRLLKEMLPSLVMLTGGHNQLNQSVILPRVLVNILSYEQMCELRDMEVDQCWIQIFSTLIACLHEVLLSAEQYSIIEIMLRKYRRLISQEQWQAVVDFASNDAHGCISYILQEDKMKRDPDLASAACDLLIAVAEAAFEGNEIFTQQTDFRWKRIISSFILTFGRDKDGKWSKQLLGFWDEYIDNATMLDDRNLSVYNSVMEVVTDFPVRLTLQEGLDEDSEEYEILLDLRIEVHDILKAAYAFFQSDLVPGQCHVLVLILVRRLLTPLGTSSAEAVLSALNSIAEYAIKNADNDTAVREALHSGVFQPLYKKSKILEHEVNAAVGFVGVYAPFFERHPEHLPAVFQYLFSAIESGSNQVSKSSTSAAEAIKKLCHYCRSQIVAYVNDLFEKYEHLQRHSAEVTSGVRIALLGALASVSRTLDDTTGKRDGIIRVLKFIGIDLQRFQAYESQFENAEDLGLIMLRCIRDVEQSYSSGTDATVAIDLDNEDQKAVMSDPAQLAQAQERLTSFVETLITSKSLAESEEAFRLACEIFRAQSLGDVRYPSHLYLAILRLSLDKDLATNYALNTFSEMLTSRRKERDVSLDLTARGGLTVLYNYIEPHLRKDDDPDILVDAFNLLRSYVEGYPDLLQENMTTFTAVLEGITRIIAMPEALPKAAACELWTSLLQNRDIGSLVAHLSDKHLQLLVWTLCEQVSGAALQRDLDYLARPIAALTAKASPVRSVFEAAFRQMETQGKPLWSWQRFVAQIFMLRGKRTETRNVVKQFWQECNQMQIVQPVPVDLENDDGVIELDFD